MIYLALLIWWFAVLDRAGNIQFSEHRDYKVCKTYERTYARVKFLTVTECKWRPNKDNGEDVG